MLVLTMVAGGGTAGSLANARLVSMSPALLCIGVRNVLIPEFERTGNRVTNGGAFVVICFRNRSAYTVSGSTTTSTSALPKEIASEDISYVPPTDASSADASGWDSIMGTTLSSPIGSSWNMGGMTLSVTDAAVVVCWTGARRSLSPAASSSLVITGLETILGSTSAGRGWEVVVAGRRWWVGLAVVVTAGGNLLVDPATRIDDRVSEAEAASDSLAVAGFEDFGRGLDVVVVVVVVRFVVVFRRGFFVVVVVVVVLVVAASSSASSSSSTSSSYSYSPSSSRPAIVIISGSVIFCVVVRIVGGGWVAVTLGVVVVTTRVLATVMGVAAVSGGGGVRLRTLFWNGGDLLDTSGVMPNFEASVSKMTEMF